MNEKVLITDCWTRKSLSCVRSLGIENIEVDVISHTLLSPAIYSKFAKRHFILPSPKKNPEEYKKRLINLLKTGNYSCIIVLEDETIMLLLDIRREIEKYTKFPIVSKDKFYNAFDKWEALKIAEKSDVPAPKSYLPHTKKEIENAIKKIGFPLIIKPRMSSGSRGIRKAYNQTEFKEYYNDIRKRYGEPIIQECLPVNGQGLGCGLLADGKKAIVNFSYKRLREYPLNGGPSTLRESTDDKLIKKYSERILKTLGWFGIAMVEFKMDEKDGKPKFLEINPRLWGSIELSKKSGINFPYLLYKLANEEKIEKQFYKTGIRCRWLIPGDILHFLSNKDRFNLKPSFFNFFDKRTYYDEFDRQDLKGTIATLIMTFLSIFNIETWKIGIFRR